MVEWRIELFAVIPTDNLDVRVVSRAIKQRLGLNSFAYNGA